ncbi:hypothetical protein GCM10009133_02990 [Cocleimonas flava]|uniref:PilX-like prepilin protein n=1 Tax=Cocleimonas flava TaxID=634765 RepID=A0A4R1F4B6_9GAMM|nr:pilus assembly PilX N-terminal domain-containing protein [Cocleimonas flava]TCJ85271.1 PilX-like prepilin protein [Cocleimonas flava]
MITKNNLKLSHQQRGATLFTSLVFLALMTVVSVSATKVSLLDLLVAGNNQQQMRNFQDTENELKKLTRVEELMVPMIHETPGEEFNATTGIFSVPAKAGDHGVEREIRDTFKRYTCGGFEGQAVSIGPDVAPCDLYDFQVRQRASNSGVKDRHNRGAGKEKPNANKNSYL